MPGYHLRRASPSNAYMLVYVRISDWDRVFCPVSKEDLNVHLRRRLEVGLRVLWSATEAASCGSRAEHIQNFV